MAPCRVVSLFKKLHVKFPSTYAGVTTTLQIFSPPPFLISGIPSRIPHTGRMVYGKKRRFTSRLVDDYLFTKQNYSVNKIQHITSGKELHQLLLRMLEHTKKGSHKLLAAWHCKTSLEKTELNTQLKLMPSTHVHPHMSISPSLFPSSAILDSTNMIQNSKLPAFGRKH